MASPYFPLPIRERGITGLNALRTIVLLLDKFRIRTCLFCIDREHIRDIDKVKETLEKYGFQLKGFEEISKSRTFEISVDRGGRALKILLVIFGREAKIEEDIKELARISGCELPDIKISTIKKILLPKVTVDHIKKVFSHLCDAVFRLEKFLNNN